MRDMPPVHPGEILREEFLNPLGLTVYAVAKAIGVPSTRLHAIVHEKRGITADTALRLGRFFRTGGEIWMNLQAHYDLQCAQELHGAAIEAEVQPSELVAA
jgi:addiction module HigA family antidote